MCDFVVILIFALNILNEASAKVPDYISPCEKNANLTECLGRNFDNIITTIRETGDESLKVPPLGKINMDRLTIQATRDLVVTIIDTNIFGFDTLQSKKISIEGDELHLSFLMPILHFQGSYVIKGQIMIISLEGTGPLNVTFVDMSIDYKAKLKTEERKGRSYYYVDNNLEDSRLRIKSMGRAYYHFDNLFDGDPRLGPEINMFLNENWEEVFTETQDAMEMGLSVYIINPIINGFLRRIPVKSLFVN